MQNPELSGKVLEHATALGVGLACDDFGTGYSALANLRRLPFDTLKIDRAFLEDDGVDVRATIIFDAITHLAHDLNLNVVAEGVETEEQQERLRQRGCDYAQGFFIGEPVSKDRVIEALGGLPYTSDKSALTQLWDRLLGKEEDKKKAQSAMPSPQEQAADVAELQSLEEPLEPWTPESEDVYDAVLAGEDLPLQTSSDEEPQTDDTQVLIYPPIETPKPDSVDLSMPEDEIVTEAEDDDQEEIAVQDSKAEAEKPEPKSAPTVGAAPMAPPVARPKTPKIEHEPETSVPAKTPVQPQIKLPKQQKLSADEQPVNHGNVSKQPMSVPTRKPKIKLAKKK